MLTTTRSTLVKEKLRTLSSHGKTSSLASQFKTPPKLTSPQKKDLVYSFMLENPDIARELAKEATDALELAETLNLLRQQEPMEESTTQSGHQSMDIPHDDENSDCGTPMDQNLEEGWESTDDSPSTDFLLKWFENRAKVNELFVFVHDCADDVRLSIRKTEHQSTLQLQIGADLSCSLVCLGVQNSDQKRKKLKHTLQPVKTKQDFTDRLKILDYKEVQLCPGVDRFVVRNKVSVERFTNVPKNQNDYVTNSDKTRYYASSHGGFEGCSIINEGHTDRQRRVMCTGCRKLMDRWRQKDTTPEVKIPHKNTPHKFMTGDQMKRKFQVLQQEKQDLKKELKYLQQEMEAQRTIILNEATHRMYDNLLRMCTHGHLKGALEEFLDDPQNNCGHLKSVFASNMKLSVPVELDSSGNHDMDSFWQEQRILQRKIKQNPNAKYGHRWSLHTVRILLAIHMKSSSAYHEMQKSGVFILPSEQTLRRYANQGKEGSGLHAGTFTAARAAWNSFKKLIEKKPAPAPPRVTAFPRDPVVSDVLPEGPVRNINTKFSLNAPDGQPCHATWKSVVQTANEDRLRSDSGECRRVHGLSTRALDLTNRDSMNMNLCKPLGDPRVN